ncbi:hypothetical protein LINGRAHAP2_LOCUS27581 [Linum grandiflorum]
MFSIVGSFPLYCTRIAIPRLYRFRVHLTNDRVISYAMQRCKHFEIGVAKKGKHFEIDAVYSK